MKKICFITLGNLYLAPYIKNYIQNINHKFDVIYWDRYGIDECIDNGNMYAFKHPIEKCGAIKKLFLYFAFRSFAKKILRENKYDVVVLLESLTGVVLFNYLTKKYKKKYIVDIRDYSIEGNKILYFCEKKLINNSLLNVISSEGYKSFLPNSEYLLVHNFSSIDASYQKRIVKRTDYPIKIGYIGLIRFIEQNKKIIDFFKNDKRFELHFVGQGSDDLKEYIVKNNIFNVKLVDRFPPEKTFEYYNTIDIVMNIYGNHQPLLDYALSNKLYYAAALRMPILVSKDTYMEKVSVGNGFGFVVDFCDSDKDNLVEYMASLDDEVFINNCEAFMNSVNSDNIRFNEILSSLFD